MQTKLKREHLFERAMHHCVEDLRADLQTLGSMIPEYRGSNSVDLGALREELASFNRLVGEALSLCKLPSDRKDLLDISNSVLHLFGRASKY